VGQHKTEQALDKSSNREVSFLTDEMERHFSICMKHGCVDKKTVLMMLRQ